jgi:pyridinium-3,5-bisthiocarboxylic acid mononucleotide nickel chelatase
MRIAYLDCFSGISGDMFLGALVDAGLPVRVLEETVAALNRVAELNTRLEIARVTRGGISATKVNVWVGDEKDQPRLEHHRYQGHKHGHTHEHAHANVLGHEQHHSHVVGTAVLEHPQSHRGLREILEIIERADIARAAKQKAVAIFEVLALAEAKIHEVDMEKIHFHEVGAADAIVDIVCAAVGSEVLAVESWVCSPLNVGSGTVACAHGEFPVPAPATAELLKNAPVFSSGIKGELVTPTGAAIVKVLASRFAPLPQLKVASIGYGAGMRDFAGHANVVRLLIGTADSAADTDSLSSRFSPEITQDTVAVLEANLDDLNPQVFGYVMDRLLSEGALDVFYTPVQMKRNRPGMLLTLLAPVEHAERLAKLLFSETTTLGLRVRQEKRLVLARGWEIVNTPWGDVRIKVANLNGASTNHAPEYEDCRRIAQEYRIPLKTVMQEALRLYFERNDG